MVILIVLGILSFVASVYGIFNGDMLAFYACLFWCIVFIVLILYIKREQKKSRDFIKWAQDNWYYIEQGVAQYNGRDICKDTRITSYVFCVSAFLFSSVFHTRVVIVGTFESTVSRIVNILLTLVFGWWAIPRGPIYTVILTFKNLTGGNKMTIATLMEKIKGEELGIDFTQTDEYRKIKESKNIDMFNIYN